MSSVLRIGQPARVCRRLASPVCVVQEVNRIPEVRPYYDFVQYQIISYTRALRTQYCVTTAIDTRRALGSRAPNLEDLHATAMSARGSQDNEELALRVDRPRPVIV